MSNSEGSNMEDFNEQFARALATPGPALIEAVI